MAKKGIVTKARVLVACKCSRCGQASNAQAGTVHFGCHGMPEGFFDRVPGLKGRISNPDRKGTWQPVEQVAAA